jgi:hypothetical protein
MIFCGVIFSSHYNYFEYGSTRLDPELLKIIFIIFGESSYKFDLLLFCVDAGPLKQPGYNGNWPWSCEQPVTGTNKPNLLSVIIGAVERVL